MASFANIDELIRVLSWEKVLLKHMFANRKGVNVRYDAVRELVEYKEERVRYLIDFGVLHDSWEFVEMEDVYSRGSTIICIGSIEWLKK